MAIELEPTPDRAEALGIGRAGRIHWNLGPAALYEEALRRQEGVLAADGPLVCRTGQHTGRSPNDKFVVRESSTEHHIDWGGVNRGMDEASFEALHRDMRAYFHDQDVFALDAWAGTDATFRMPIRVVTELAWHNLFARNMFLPGHDASRQPAHQPAFTVVDAPNFTADPAKHGTRSDVFIVIHFRRRLVLIGGTHYAGEIKKSIFTLLNYMLPMRGVLPMHCSANIGRDGDTALFFGLSGTGKTTLSSDPERRLIGDDEHGWSENGVFNFEDGCYAKVIFNVEMPIACPGVPEVVLDPRSTWRDAAQYDAQARSLARMFVENFKTFEVDVTDAVRKAGPTV
jgi:phosphoenolpyruvate carboxykinase (ATP)